MKRNASARWEGDLKSGNGRVSSESGALANVPYSFTTRFENEKGTNPEELIAAAHAGCFSMALANILAKAGHTPKQVDTTASVSLEKGEAGFSITAVHLVVRAKVPGADPAGFDKAANEAKAGCPVSRVLNAKITMDATLVS